LFIVWDACRLDTAEDHAPTLMELASDNVWFENAITPAGWSLPSHASMFTGNYPHEHGIWRIEDSIGALPLLETVRDRGYYTAGVSANGFASARTGFSESFDEFYSTVGQAVYPEGVDVNEFHLPDASGLRGTGTLCAHVLREVCTHEYPLKSAANAGAAAMSKLAGRFPLLERIPHPRVSNYVGFSYDPDQTTRMVTRCIAGIDGPFFTFANYMDAHHPYAPPARYQEEFCGRTFSHRELAEINESVHPRDHLSNLQRNGPLDQESVETVRNLYNGEVRSADDQLETVLNGLEQRNLLEDTLVVITADHGENLGEEDLDGRQRFGHETSVTDSLLRVPMVVANPALEGERVEGPTSLRNLYELFDQVSDESETLTNELVRDCLTEDVVYSQFPATGKGEVIADECPTIPQSLFERHIVCAYDTSWKLVLTSRDEARCWKDGSEVPTESAPADLRNECERVLSIMVGEHDDTGEIDEAVQSRLSELGYV
jgi:arylsulfatase A-like enzyme